MISKWRAWVDLDWAGDDREALVAVTEGVPGDLVAEKLGEAWTNETAWMEDWKEVLDAGVREAHLRSAGIGLPVESMLGFDPENPDT